MGFLQEDNAIKLVQDKDTFSMEDQEEDISPDKRDPES